MTLDHYSQIGHIANPQPNHVFLWNIDRFKNFDCIEGGGKKLHTDCWKGEFFVCGRVDTVKKVASLVYDEDRPKDFWIGRRKEYWLEQATREIHKRFGSQIEVRVF